MNIRAGDHASSTPSRVRAWRLLAALAVAAVPAAVASCGSSGADGEAPPPCTEDCGEDTPDAGDDVATDGAGDADVVQPDGPAPDGGPQAACRAIEDNGGFCLDLKAYSDDTTAGLHDYANKVLAWQGVPTSAYTVATQDSFSCGREGETCTRYEITFDVGVVLGGMLAQANAVTASSQEDASHACSADPTCVGAPAACGADAGTTAAGTYQLAAGLVQQPAYGVTPGSNVDPEHVGLGVKLYFDGDAPVPTDATRVSLQQTCGAAAFTAPDGSAIAAGVAEHAEILGALSSSGGADPACFFVDVKGKQTIGGKSHWGYAVSGAIDVSNPVGAPSKLSLCLNDGITCGFDATPLGLVVPTITFTAPACAADAFADYEVSCGWTAAMKAADGWHDDQAQPTFCSATDPRVWGVLASILEKQLGVADDCGRTPLDTLATMLEAALANIALTQMDATKVTPALPTDPSVALSGLEWVDASFQQDGRLLAHFIVTRH